MDYYFENEVLVVPKNYDQSDTISSPTSWSQWGITEFSDSVFSEKNFNGSTDKSIYNPIDAEKFSHERQNSKNPSIYNNDDSLLWNDQVFAEEQASINHMDDLFISSLLEDETTKYSQRIPSYEQSLGSSKFLKTEDFPPSLDWENGQVSGHCLMQYTSDENSIEESVLQELGRVTSQFTEKTRICFRDSLYRLAENAKYSCQDGDSMLTSTDGTEKEEETESKTNGIDRAIANLMFTKVYFEEEDGNDDNTEQQQQQQQQNEKIGDAEVPIARDFSY